MVSKQYWFPFHPHDLLVLSGPPSSGAPALVREDEEAEDDDRIELERSSFSLVRRSCAHMPPPRYVENILFGISAKFHSMRWPSTVWERVKTKVRRENRE